MEILRLSSAFGALVGKLFLSALVLSRGWKSSLNQSFLFLSLTLISYEFNYILSYPDFNPQFLSTQLMAISGALSVIALLWFVSVITKNKREVWLVKLYSLLSLPLIISTQTSAFRIIRSISPSGEILYITHPLWQMFFSFYLFSALTHCLFSLQCSARVAFSPPERNKYQWLFGGVLLATVGILTDYLDILRIGGIRVFPGGIIGNLLLTGIFAHVIITHHLIDVKEVISRSSIFIVLTLILSSLYLGIEVAFKVNFKARVTAILLITFGVVLTFPLVHTFFEEFIRKVFFKKRVLFQNLAKEITEHAPSFIELEDVFRFVTPRLVSILGVDRVSFYFKKPYSENYSEEFTTQPGEKASLTSSEPLIEKLKKGEVIFSKSTSSPLTLSQEKLKALKGEVALPLVSHGALEGFILLGKKRNSDPWSSEEIDLLTALTHQILLAIRQARLAQEVLQAKSFETAAKIYTTLDVHELRNALGNLALLAKNLETRVTESDFREFFSRALTQVLAKIEEFRQKLKQPNIRMELKFTQSNINKIIEDTLKLLHWPEIEVVKKLTPLPDTYLAPEALTKTFKNILTNSREAIVEKGNKKGVVEITSRVVELENEKYIKVTFQDNGGGIPEDFLQRRLFRIFETTKKTGLGLGLFMAKRVIEAHQGKIELQSEVMKGTLVKIYLPIKGGRIEGKIISN
jgi:signal transduction histidine kinase